jgi:5-methylcytosine-specific restriction protein A
MARKLPEWRGKTDDSRPPPRVRLRIFDREKGVCHECHQPILPGEKWQCDHRPALVNGGQNRESMMFPVHDGCHRNRTARDVAEARKVQRSRQKHVRAVDGPKMQSQPMATTKQAAARKQKATGKIPIPPRRALYGKKGE